jgi:hypothetical protein
MAEDHLPYSTDFPDVPEEIEDSSSSKSLEDRSKAEGEPAEDEGSGYIQPIVDNRNVTFITRIFNSNLSCTLCNGYLREAYTLKECLHR